MDALPAPLVPAFVNLQDFEFMPLRVKRLIDSGFSAHTTAEEFRAGVLLWSQSWHEVPAGSLPDDDVDLAKAAGFGRVVAEWRKVRTGALRGFVKCSDGRLYHPVIAELAMRAWESKVVQAHKTECRRINKANERAAIKTRPPTLDEFRLARLWITVAAESPDTPCRSDKGPMSQRQGANVAATPPPKRCETASKGEGEGYISPYPLGDKPADPPPTPPTPPPLRAVTPPDPTTLPPGMRGVVAALQGAGR